LHEVGEGKLDHKVRQASHFVQMLKRTGGASRPLLRISCSNSRLRDRNCLSFTLNGLDVTIGAASNYSFRASTLHFPPPKSRLARAAWLEAGFDWSFSFRANVSPDRSRNLCQVTYSIGIKKTPMLLAAKWQGQQHHAADSGNDHRYILIDRNEVKACRCRFPENAGLALRSWAIVGRATLAIAPSITGITRPIAIVMMTQLRVLLLVKLELATGRLARCSDEVCIKNVLQVEGAGVGLGGSLFGLEGVRSCEAWLQ
jgi:hypothetical protein